MPNGSEELPEVEVPELESGLPERSEPAPSKKELAPVRVATGLPNPRNVEVIGDGVKVYLGTTGIGKTVLAVAHLEARHNALRRGALVIDSAHAKQLAHLQETKTLKEAVQRVWGQKEIIRWTPRSVEEFDQAILAAEHGGGIDLFVDELSFWKQSRFFLRLCRVWRHSKVTILVTCQHVGMDVAQSLLGCNPELYLFRVTAPRSLEWVMKWHGIDPDFVRGLGVGQYIVKSF